MFEFQVLYIGKIKISEKKVPETFIDEALDKFKVHELEKHKSRQIGTIGKLKSENDIVARAKVMYFFNSLSTFLSFSLYKIVFSIYKIFFVINRH